MQGHECTFIYMHIDLLSNPIIFFPLMHGRLFNIIYPTSKYPPLPSLRFALIAAVCVQGGRGGGWWLLFLVLFSCQKILFDLTATQKPHYLPPHLAGAGRQWRLCRVPSQTGGLNVANRDGKRPTNTGELFWESGLRGGCLFARP